MVYIPTYRHERAIERTSARLCALTKYGGRDDRFAVGSGTTTGVVAFVGRSVGQSVNSLSTSSTQKRRSSVNRGRVSIQIYNLIQESSGSGLQQQLTRILNDCVNSVSALNYFKENLISGQGVS